MKKLLIFLITFLSLTGCSNQTEDVEAQPFILGEAQEQVYEGLIAQTLADYYWYYDDTSLAYFDATVPQDREENSQLFKASLETGFNLKEFSGKSAVMYNVNLVHFNSMPAGVAHFYFIRDNLVGVYHESALNEGNYLALSTRNVFTRDIKIAKAEGVETISTFKQQRIGKIPNGFVSQKNSETGGNLYLSIENDKVLINKFSGRAFFLQYSISNFGEGLVPISATFLPDGTIGVIAGTVLTSENEGDASKTFSQKVMFFDENYQGMDMSIPLENGTYSCIAVIEKSMALINQHSLYTYALEGGIWVDTGSFGIGVQATAFNQNDIDGDGQNEYLVTDTKDFYIFKYINGLLSCVWRTNISTNSFLGNIYTGDLSGDKVPEIYIADTTGTAIRYTITPTGLVAKNEDIMYGDAFYVSDFNNDGLCDYIKVSGEESATKELFLGEK